MDQIPSSRSEWAKLEWKEAQTAVGELLHHRGFMKLEEMRIGRGRADLVVIRKIEKSAVVGIIEVKCYNRITPKLQLSSMKQACKYLSQLYLDFQNNGYWKRKKIRYFIAAVFTKDYPVRDYALSPKERIDHLPNDLFEIPIILCSPDRLLSRLEDRNLMGNVYDPLDSFFDSSD